MFEDLGIPYTEEVVVRSVYVQVSNITMYLEGQEDDTTEVFLVGHEQAHTVMLHIRDFEIQMNR